VANSTSTTSRTFCEKIYSEGPYLTKFLQDDANAFSTWKAFFSISARLDVDVFKRLLSLRPEVASLRYPGPFEFRGKFYNGCTLLHLMLLLKPCRAYLDLTTHLIPDCDADGNSSLLYAALGDSFDIYERVWKACGADGESARKPGPETALILLKSGWNHILKRDVSLTHVIESVGGHKAALKVAVKGNYDVLASELMKGLENVKWEEFIQLALDEALVDFKTFMTVIDHAILRENTDVTDQVLQRAYYLCRKPQHYMHFLRLVKVIREHFELSQSLDDLVAFTGTPYLLLHTVYKYPKVMNILNKISSHKPINPEVFDMKSSEFGSYLHVVCKKIEEFEHYANGPYNAYYSSFNFWYIPHLLQVTKSEHWQVVDAHGKKPMDYLVKSANFFTKPFFDEICQRSVSMKKQ
jgi:hypothetical protein